MGPLREGLKTSFFQKRWFHPLSPVMRAKYSQSDITLVCVKPSASKLLQLKPKPFPGKVVLAGSKNAVQSAYQFPSPRHLLHFN